VDIEGRRTLCENKQTHGRLVGRASGHQKKNIDDACLGGGIVLGKGDMLLVKGETNYRNDMPVT